MSHEVAAKRLILDKIKQTFLQNEEKPHDFWELFMYIFKTFCFQIQNMNRHLVCFRCTFQNATYFISMCSKIPSATEN